MKNNRYLIDTHILLWWLIDDPRLTPSERHIIEHDDIWISSASTWEISMKKTIGKLIAPDNLIEIMKQCNFFSLPITIEHTLAVEKLPRHHDDPFDRILIAQAQCEQLSIITQDSKIKKYLNKN